MAEAWRDQRNIVVLQTLQSVGSGTAGVVLVTVTGER